MSTDLHVVMDNLVEDYKMLSEELVKIKKIRDAKIKAIEDAYIAKQIYLEEKQQYVTEQLRILTDKVPQKHSKTQFKVTLLTGEVVVRKPYKKLTADKDKLLEWLKDNDCFKGYIKGKITEIVDWKEFKKRISLDEETGIIVDTETGETLDIPSITTEEVAEQILIK